MERYNESDFAEVIIDRMILESFAESDSPYFQQGTDDARKQRHEKLRSRVRWHISRSLPPRQREVIKLILRGKEEREIAEILSISRRVVNDYKHRAISRIRNLINPSKRKGNLRELMNEACKKLRIGADRILENRLSPREKEVALEILNGAGEKEIAEKMGINRRVVNSYKNKALNKIRLLVDNIGASGKTNY
jgi:DNA-binding CsgD family transcriptional regulator